MSVGFESQGFFANNGGEFANIKLDELTSQLGLSQIWTFIFTMVKWLK